MNNEEREALREALRLRLIEKATQQINTAVYHCTLVPGDEIHIDFTYKLDETWFA